MMPYNTVTKIIWMVAKTKKYRIRSNIHGALNSQSGL